MLLVNHEIAWRSSASATATAVVHLHEKAVARAGICLPLPLSLMCFFQEAPLRQQRVKDVVEAARVPGGCMIESRTSYEPLRGGETAFDDHGDVSRAHRECTLPAKVDDSDENDERKEVQAQLDAERVAARVCRAPWECDRKRTL